jgi:hypothetical protein
MVLDAEYADFAAASSSRGSYFFEAGTGAGLLGAGQGCHLDDRINRRRLRVLRHAF